MCEFWWVGFELFVPSTSSPVSGPPRFSKRTPILGCAGTAATDAFSAVLVAASPTGKGSEDATFRAVD